MICDSCIHVIFRTYRNGPNEEYYRWSCDIDGKELNVQLHACTRKEEKKVEQVYSDIAILSKAKPVVTMEEFANPPKKEVPKSKADIVLHPKRGNKRAK